MEVNLKEIRDMAERLERESYIERMEWYQKGLDLMSEYYSLERVLDNVSGSNDNS